jgi:hypothetical protein
LNHPIIDTLAQLDSAAAQQFWNSEDRSVWKDDLLRQSETLDILTLKQFLPTSISEDKTARTAIPVFSTFMWDKDLRNCFIQKSSERSSSDEQEAQFQFILEQLAACNQTSLMGIMLRPGFWMTESWPDEEERLRNTLRIARKNRVLVFRNGFITHHADILLAADLGFTGVQIHAGDLDLFELQMAIELARDCKLCPVVSVSNEAQMEQVIQTDAPHIALCHFPSEGHESTIRFIQNALPKIPSNCTRLLMTASRSESELQLFGRLGFQAIIHFGS